MNKFAVCIAAIVVLIGRSALAADIAVRALPPAPVRVFNWTGWYIGLNVGGGWGSNGLNNSFTPGACVGAGTPTECANQFALLNATLPGQFDIHPNGFIGGGQIGYNYQTGAVVVGLETDFQGANLRGNANAAASVAPNFPGALLTTAGTGSEKIDWFGTLRGRLGWTPAAPLLVYMTGGLAYGHVQTGASFSEQAFISGVLNSSGSTAISQSDTRAGWTAGGGLEWMLAPQWSIKGEYLYYDLGKVSLNQTLVVVSAITPSSFLTDDIQSATHYRGNIARIGLNYRFW
jgi:outer membrane immunogenic protein